MNSNTWLLFSAWGKETLFPEEKGFPSPRPPSFRKGRSLGKGDSCTVCMLPDTLIRILPCGLSSNALCAPLPAGADARAPEHAPSWRLAYELMRRAHIAVTPGRDFGDFGTADCLRFSTASSMEHLQQAVARIRALLEQ